MATKQSSYSLIFQNSVDQIWTFSEGNRRILTAHFTKYIHFSEGIRRILAAHLTGMAHDCSQQLLRFYKYHNSHINMCHLLALPLVQCSAVCIIWLLPKIRWICLKSMKFGRKSVDFLKAVENSEILIGIW